ncbi:hypothetical protein FNF31_01614 [Cafeteria roenbergensis]|uniref:histidine kinase n=1 Tax=Cafeteria roenbergensis TaxID=33653 RepID=A0A5A8DQ60_CAFRO|nr:hypothetical protein FNF31_01614 [Cafeteria roenbergensis]
MRRAAAVRRIRTGAFNGRVKALARLFERRRLVFAREGASARIAHAFRVFAFRKRCKHGLRRTINEKATTIQRVYRGHVGRKHARALRAMQVRLATHAQRIWRAKVARRKLAEIRERRIVNWAAARMQSVFRGKRQRVIMRLWKGRRWMAAASMQTAWRLYRAQTRRLDKQDDDLTTWMLALLDLGYSRDPIKPGVELRLAHKRALLKRLRGDMREAEDGEGKDDADALPAGGVTKTVLASKEDVRAQIRALNQVPAGVMDPRKARRPVVTTAKVWSMASRNRKKTKIASGALRGRAAMIAAAGGGKDAAAGARGSVYMGPPPVVAKPRILIHIPAAMAERIAEGRAEADRIQRELDEEELEAMGEQGGADGGGADGVAPQGGGGSGGGGPAAKAQRPGILKRAAAAAKAAARNIGGAEAAAALAPGPAASGDDPAWHPLEAPPGARFDRRDKYGQPSLQEVMDDMRRMSDALQWHMERVVREQRRKAAYAIRSAESKAQHVALRARETALRSEAAVETTRRLRSFVAGVTEIQAELRAREAGLRAHAEEQERQMRRARAQVRKADRAARDDLRRAGGLLDAAELGRILAMLPSVEAIRATTAASRASVGDGNSGEEMENASLPFSPARVICILTAFTCIAAAFPAIFAQFDHTRYFVVPGELRQMLRGVNRTLLDTPGDASLDVEIAANSVTVVTAFNAVFLCIYLMGSWALLSRPIRAAAGIVLVGMACFVVTVQVPNFSLELMMPVATRPFTCALIPGAAITGASIGPLVSNGVMEALGAFVLRDGLDMARKWRWRGRVVCSVSPIRVTGVVGPVLVVIMGVFAQVSNTVFRSSHLGSVLVQTVTFSLAAVIVMLNMAVLFAEGSSCYRALRDAPSTYSSSMRVARMLAVLTLISSGFVAFASQATAPEFQDSCPEFFYNYHMPLPEGRWPAGCTDESCFPNRMRQALQYVSHEARAPLGGAILSMGLLDHAIETADQDQAGLLVSDLHLSLEAAQRQLTDLLLFDDREAPGRVAPLAESKGRRASIMRGVARQSESPMRWAMLDEFQLGRLQSSFAGACRAEEIQLDMRLRICMSQGSPAAPPTGRQGPAATPEGFSAIPVSPSPAAAQRRPSFAEGTLALSMPSPLDAGGALSARTPGGTPAPSEAPQPASTLAIESCYSGAGRVPGEPPSVSCAELFVDVDRILAIVQNALSNSIKHVRGDGTGRISVLLTLCQPAEGEEALEAGPPEAVSSRVVDSIPFIDQEGEPAEKRVLWIEVLDNGRGIPARLLQPGRLFRPFQQVRQGDGSLRMTSSGLGLSIVKSVVVEQLHGTVGLASKEGEGTLFTAKIPVRQRQAQRDGAKADAAGPDTAAGPRPRGARGARAAGAGRSGRRRGRETIGTAFVVDDERVNRTLMARLLRSWGFEVREMEDGTGLVEAVRALVARDASSATGGSGGSGGSAGSDPVTSATSLAAAAANEVLAWPLVVTLDIQMPVMDGFQALEALRALAAEQRAAGNEEVATKVEGLLVIGVTGNAVLSDRQRMMDLGAQRVLTKPVDTPALASLIEECGDVDLPAKAHRRIGAPA